ncbi:MAG: 30S ribosomal protein S8 [Candidatus Omnitrophica bacterium]|nr:30S ribosomal protein S8 [Candidatus Omnitrophota bacterium]
MSVTDTIADYITIIRNGCRAGKDSVTVPSSIMKVKITEILKREGYINDFSVVENGSKKSIFIKLRYKKDGSPAIRNLTRVSTPGLRRYVESRKVPRVLRGIGTMVVSTSQGVLTDDEARKQNVGGELIFKVW